MNTVEAELFTPAPEWTGRNDGPGPEHARWHSTVQPAQETPDNAVALLGFASDEGVLRNGGRQGAAAGPEALRTALGSLAIHHEHPLYDAGTITTQGNNLEQAHDALSDKVEELTAKNNLVIVLGGGHETAFGSHRGAYQTHGPLKIVNLDAHFDLRQADQPTSGTPFKQISELSDDFDYSVFGISKPNNTPVLFQEAEDLGVEVVLDEELLNLTPEQAGELAAKATENKDKVHLSIDLDVLPAHTAPGVSAPAALGVSLPHIHAMATDIARTGKLALVDVVELNPDFDIDNRTAKAAARLIDDIVTAHVSS